MTRTLVTLMAAAALLASPAPAQTPKPQQRDLKIEKETEPPPLPEGVQIPRSYALVVGIAEYPNLEKKQQLQFTQADAEAIYSILISPEGGNYRAENVHKLIGSQATLANLTRELETWLPSVVKDNDRVLIYFAGHGFIYDGRAYLAPQDIDPANGAASAYSMERLGAVVGGKIRARSKILITDACHSGAIRPEDTQSINHSLVDLRKSMFSMTASRDREVSFESRLWGGGHGIFTYYVVRGMEGEADQNGDGIVTADELQDYVYRNVRDATKGQQNPTADQGSFDPNMLISWIPSHTKPAQTAELKYGTLVVESNMDGVEIYLDDKLVKVINKNEPLLLEGLEPRAHRVKAVKMGYEPFVSEEMVYPNQKSAVSVRILVQRRPNRAAVDSLDRGKELYSKGFKQNYELAIAQFTKALQLDPTYSEAALYLGRTYNALYDEANAEKYFRLAIKLDPDYLEAHSGLGAMLLDLADTDGAVREFNSVLQRKPNDPVTLTNLAQAYRMKGLYPESVESARKAVSFAPEYAEPHLWMGESLRLSAHYDASLAEYGQYLKLSNFQSKLSGQLNYYVVGYLIGMGKKNRATQQDIWKDLRNLAWFGSCDCERKLKHYDLAIPDCQKALTYDPSDAYTHYALALSYAGQGAHVGSYELLAAAVQHFQAMLQLNPDLQEAGFAKQNISSLQKALSSR